MEPYLNLSGQSGIRGFQTSEISIEIWFFGNNRSFLYSYQSAGAMNVEKMKELAEAGQGLNRFIRKHVNDKYEEDLSSIL